MSSWVRLMKMYRRPCSVPRTLISKERSHNLNSHTGNWPQDFFIKKVFGRGNTSKPSSSCWWENLSKPSQHLPAWRELLLFLSLPKNLRLSLLGSYWLGFCPCLQFYGQWPRPLTMSCFAINIYFIKKIQNQNGIFHRFVGNLGSYHVWPFWQKLEFGSQVI